MTVSLAKGQKVDLTKSTPGLTKIVIGLGWDVNAFDSGSAFDLDTAAFVLNASGKVLSDADFVFYNNKSDSSKSVKHMGDNLSGVGDGDDEQIKIDLSNMPESAQKVAFTVTINDAEARRQNFGQVSNAFIRIMNEADGTELLRYDLSEDFSIETAVVVGEIYRNGAEWKFNATGSGFQGGLTALCNYFGVSI